MANLDLPTDIAQPYTIASPADTVVPPAPLEARAAPEARPLAVETVPVWGLTVARVSSAEAVDLVDRLIERGRPAMFITANLHYARLTRQDPRLEEVNRRAAFILADGAPLVWYSRLAGRPLPERVAGADLVYQLCGRAAARGHRVFLLGGAPGVAREAAAGFLRRWPELRIVGAHSPPRGPWTSEENEDLLARIRNVRPDLLLVALGQPKGELWLDANGQALGVPACVQIGASLDFVAGRVRRAPRWLQRLGLEWAWRIMQEPRRMAPRYAADAWFLANVMARDAIAPLRRQSDAPRATGNA